MSKCNTSKRNKPDRHYSHGKHVTLIAEIGINHMGSVDMAKQMVIKSKLSGADIAKFQLYDPITVLGVDSPYLDEAISCRLSKYDHAELKHLCDKIGIEYCCSVFHPSDVGFLNEVGVNRFKLASRSCHDLPLLMSIASLDKPVIASVGLCDKNDIIRIIKIFKNNDLTLMYCVCKYPTPLENIDMSRMATLGKNNGVKIGFSSHCPSIAPSLAAAARGAAALENHVVLDKSQKGCDVSSSIDFDDYTNMSRIVMDMEKMEKI